MKECLELQHIAECCGICHVTVCERPDNQLSVNIQWKSETEVMAEQTIVCDPSCKKVHDLLIANGVEMSLADRVCSHMKLN
ncbi:MAG: hypothetical protein ACM3ZQ_06755 [Bacillota bacterium]